MAILSKKKVTSIISLFVVALMIFCVSAQHADAYTLRGDSEHGSVLYYHTNGKAGNVTLTQTKGTIFYKRMKYGNPYLSKKTYGIYYVTVYIGNSNKIYKGYKNKKWDGKKIKLSLEKNKKYRVCVNSASIWSYKVGPEPLKSNRYWNPVSTWKETNRKNVYQGY